MKKVFRDTFTHKIIYIMTIENKTHEGLLKIGETTIDGIYDIEKIYDNQKELNEAAISRIDSYTKTAGIKYKIFYTTLAVDKNNLAFRDYDVHEVLKRSNIKQPKENLNGATEWFIVDLNTAKNAIYAVKNGKKSLNSNDITKGRTPIIFRPEQQEAINLTIKQFTSKGQEKNSRAHMLWNAKMRFGKTLSALEVIKQMAFDKTLIITHRPVVKHSWFDDFDKIFYDNKLYSYGSKNLGYTTTNLNEMSKFNKNKFVYFASIQDLRGSSKVGGKFNKNHELFSTKWDFIIIDEAHEGTQTTLGNDVINNLIECTPKTKTLFLSGTPFNLLSPQSKQVFNEDEVYTWDYVMEQRAKLEWVEQHFGDSNPYESLPRMNIYTYDLSNIITNNKYKDIEDTAFNFKEFFRVWTGNSEIDRPKLGDLVKPGSFVYEKDIKKFLDLLVDYGENNYPFSTIEYRDNFRHTLWMLPGVKEAKALSLLMKEHHVFQHFKIVNVAGEGDEEVKSEDALIMVQKAIGNKPEQTRTITLSCGRLTTGVSVPGWTAVFMLSGSSSISASSYLQTIFRVQTPANIGNKIKSNCYVFDFAPDRTLKMVAEAGNLSTKKGAVNDSKTQMGEFLNFCPVIAVKGSEMKAYSTENMLTQLKRALIDRVAKNGFDDRHLYNDKLLQLSELELKRFDDLKKTLKTTKTSTGNNDILINDQGLNDEVRDEKNKTKKKKELSPEEKALLQERQRKFRERSNAISVLRGIAIRIPLLVYGADIDINQKINISNFAQIIDDKSWKEFMPEGVTKEKFNEFSIYFDNEVFVEAGLKIRRQAKAADALLPLERIQAITNLFATFKNPDKETVLTPWKTVNTHIGECLGGANFFDDNYENQIIIDEKTSTRWIIKEKLTNFIFNRDSKILEINSKSGLYPLYAAISIYQYVKSKGYTKDISNLWKDILKDNVYVICRTKMAAAITKRTLRGFEDKFEINVIVIEDIVDQMSKQYKDKYLNLTKNILNKRTWAKGDGVMKFNSVLGNPPYQSGNEQIYTDFYLLSRKLGDIVCLIFPVGWQEPKNSNNLSKLNTEEVKYDKQIRFIDNRENIFPGIAGVKWTNFILWEKDFDNKLNGEQLIYTNGKNPIKKRLFINQTEIFKPSLILEFGEIIKNYNGFESLYNNTSARKPYGLAADVFSRPEFYKLPKFQESRKNQNDIRIIGLLDYRRVELFVPKNYPIPKKTERLNKYKVFIPKAWGNMSEKSGLGGAYSDVFVASPNDICTESYIEQGMFEKKETAIKQAKYIMTRFVRALFYINKFSQNTPRETWNYVPIQNFTENWWEESIEEIENRLFEKYKIPNNIREFILNNIQKKDEKNIL